MSLIPVKSSELLFSEFSVSLFACFSSLQQSSQPELRASKWDPAQAFGATEPPCNPAAGPTGPQGCEGVREMRV